MILGEDIAAWRRRGLDLGAARDRRTVASELCEAGRHSDVVLVDDHADLPAMCMRLADALWREGGRADESARRGLDQQAHVAWRARELFMARNRYAWMRPAARSVFEEVLRAAGHQVHARTAFTDARRRTWVLELDGRWVTPAAAAPLRLLPLPNQVSDLVRQLEALGLRAYLCGGGSGPKRQCLPRRMAVDFGLDANGQHLMGVLDLRAGVFTTRASMPGPQRSSVRVARDVVARWVARLTERGGLDAPQDRGSAARPPGPLACSNAAPR